MTALLGMLCLCLVAWADLRWRAVLVDIGRPERLLHELRLHLQSAELQAVALRHASAETSPAEVEAALDNAVQTSTLLQDALDWTDHDAPASTALRTANDRFLRQVDALRQWVRVRPATAPDTWMTTLQTQHLDLDRSVREIERLGHQRRAERLQQQGQIAMATLGLIVLGTLVLMLLHARHARRQEALLDTLARREAHLRAFAAAMPDVSFVLDAQGTYLEVYGESDKLAAPASSLLGRRFQDMLPPEAAQRIDAIVQRALATREVTHTEYCLELRGQIHWFEARVHALPDADDRVVAISWDISERKRHEERVETLSRLYSFLSQVNQSIVWTRTPEELFDRICKVALSHGHFTMAWVVQPDAAGSRLVPVRQAGDPDRIAPEHRPVALLMDTPDRDPTESRPPAHPVLQAWRSRHLRWDVPPNSPSQAVVIPVTCSDAPAAVLVLVRAHFDPEDPEERALFLEISTDMSFALTQFQRQQQWRDGQDRIRLHAAALQSTQDGVIVSDMQQRIVSVNRAFTEITGFSEQDALGQNPGFLRSDCQEGPLHTAVRDSVLQHGRWQGELRTQHKDGHQQVLWVSIATVANELGLSTHLVTVFTDITAQKEAAVRLQQLAHIDSLTGLPNRRMVLSRMEHALAAARRQQHKVALLYIDLDNFKNVNDSLGHNAGDQLLVGVARRLAQRTRREDTLGRLGGDEFILLLETLRDSEDAAAVAQELLELLARPFEVGPSEVYVQASIGISLYPDDGTEVEDLLRDADTAMYQAKRAGRGTYRYYTEALTQAAQVRLQLDTRLRRALERHEFELWYQPLYDLKDSRLIGLEALVRLHQPGLPPVGPAEFVPVLEDTGHIVALGEWVTNEACRQGRAWLDEGLAFGRIAVNISAVEMQRGGTVARVQKALATHGLPAECLELEITESSLMQQGDHSEMFLHSLRAMGVQLAIDDFGTGYSSLSHLKRFPVGKLKIDRSFIRDLMTDPADAQLVNAMVAMGRSLGISVLAEGVETEDQMHRLREIGCEAAQGYFFGRPAPAEATRRWLLASLQASGPVPGQGSHVDDVWPVI